MFITLIFMGEFKSNPNNLSYPCFDTIFVTECRNESACVSRDYKHLCYFSPL